MNFYNFRFALTPVAVVLYQKRMNGQLLQFRHLYVFGFRVAYWTVA